MRNIGWIVLVLACVSPAAAAIPGPDDAVAASGIIQERVKARDIDVSMVEEKPYGVASWTAGHGYAAGLALMKKSKGNWAIVKMATRTFTLSQLEGSGVPAKIAKALVADLKVAGH